MTECATIANHRHGGAHWPLVFDLARASTVDGPGVRTTVFFKGCPLSCPWCHNPEGQDPGPQEIFDPGACMDCGGCERGEPCFTGARQVVGKAHSPEELVDLIEPDIPYFKASGGGVTFSGGEALGFPAHLAQTAALLKKRGVHLAVQTCGYFDFERVERELLPLVDLIYFDFKIMDPSDHKRLLGKSNRIILENFLQLWKKKIPLVPSVTLVPDLVANEKNMKAMAAFFARHGVSSFECLQFHSGGREKWARLGRPLPPAFPNAWSDPSHGDHWIRRLGQHHRRHVKEQSSRPLVSTGLY